MIRVFFMNAAFLQKKITALNMSEECSDRFEVNCVVDDRSVCISRELTCDGNINCGTYSSADEDSRICVRK